MRFIAFLLGLVVFLSAVAKGAGAQAPEGGQVPDGSPARYRIALLSDPHCSTDPRYADYLAHFDTTIRQVNDANVDAVIITGDLTQTLNPESAELFKEKAKGLKAPVKWVGGNHDLGQRADKGKPATTTAGRIQRFEAALGPVFWSADLLPGVHVIGIGGSLFGSGLDVEAAQWAFLEKELAQPREGATFVISHYPPFNRKPDEPEEYFNMPLADRARLLGLMQKGRVTAFLSGHLHYPIDLKWEGLPVIGAPAISFGLPRNVQREGWKLVTLHENNTVSAELKIIPRASAGTVGAAAGAAQPDAAAPANAPATAAARTGTVNLKSLGPIAVLPNPSSSNEALKYLQAKLGPQIEILTPQDIVSKSRFSPEKYKVAVYASGESYVRTVKKEGDIDSALRSYMLSGGILLVLSDEPYPFYMDEKGGEVTTANRFGLHLFGNGEQDESAMGFDTPPAGFDALFAPTQNMLDSWGSLPSRLDFPASGERRWRPLVPISADPKVYEPWITLKDVGGKRNYGDAAAYVRRVTTDGTGRIYRTVYVSHLLTQSHPHRDAILDAVLRQLVTNVAGGSTAAVSNRAHIFYYNWYGAPPREEGFVHWGQGGHMPPDDVGSNFYPKLGAYSSNDPAVLKQHMAWIKQARVGVVTLTWWGRNSYEDKGVRAVLDAAAEAGLQVNFHLEPYPGSNPEKFADDVGYILLNYGRHPAFYRHNGKAMFYIFETFRHPADAWRQANDRLRAFATTPVLMIAQTSDLTFVQRGGFDGGYTYDGLAPFRDPNFTREWPRIASEFKAAFKLFIPSVGPGYWDDRAVPNGAEEPESAKTRDAGKATTYDAAWQDAIASGAPIVTITSFNEWHEGSQIEPAIEKIIAGYTFPAYPAGEDQYLQQTAKWVEQLMRQ